MMLLLAADEARGVWARVKISSAVVVIEEHSFVCM
jgi:hypothetical protein